MNPLAVLGRYLVLAIVLPGMVVATAIAVLFPQLRDAGVTLLPSELRL